MDALLKELADRLGIATFFSDAGLRRQEYNVDENTIRFFVRAMGYTCDTKEETLASLRRIDGVRWAQCVRDIYVRQVGDIVIDVVSKDLSDIKIKAKDCDGNTFDVLYAYMQNSTNNGELYKEDLRLTTDLTPGYYELELEVAGKKHKTTLAVAPQTCKKLEDEQKLWGFALQLYSLKSRRNWGIGDLTDLRNFVKLCGQSGADIIGLNPLNTLSHDYPENASPYLSISRQFLNPIYIDVEAVPEFMPEDKKAIEPLLEELRASELIQYGKVYPLKVRMLEKCFDRFKADKKSDRRKAYETFCKCQGEALDNLAAFQAIYEVETQKVWGGWMAWPEDYKNPNAAGVKAFVKEHKDRVEFFKFMQFEADRQFGLAAAEVKANGLKIGFYRDLAVGVGRDSAEYWSNPELFMRNAGTGAPPDAFFPNGQKWGLGTFLPQVLQKQKYAPFIRMLRANMRYAGALRMDHVMSLLRLYVIPDASEKGTYIYYNFADMLNIVALESYLNDCVIVGESIGNVPDGFLDKLKEKNIYALSILWAERWNAGWGDFKQPADYPADAFTSVATHDIAPLKMWWFGYDIELNASLGLIGSAQDKADAYHKREADRGKLLEALDRAGVWPDDRPRSGNYIYGEAYPEGIEEAVERFMSKTTAPVFLAQLEDMLHVIEMQNLPGTDHDKHPNWRRRIPVELENLSTDSAYVRCVAAIRKER